MKMCGGLTMGLDPALVRFEAGDAWHRPSRRGATPDLLRSTRPGAESGLLANFGSRPGVWSGALPPATRARWRRTWRTCPRCGWCASCLFIMFSHTEHAEVPAELAWDQDAARISRGGLPVLSRESDSAAVVPWRLSRGAKGRPRDLPLRTEQPARQCHLWPLSPPQAASTQGSDAVPNLSAHIIRLTHGAHPGTASATTCCRVRRPTGHHVQPLLKRRTKTNQDSLCLLSRYERSAKTPI